MVVVMKIQRLIWRVLIIGFINLFFPFILGAEITFEQTYGGSENDWGNDVQQTVDKGYIITGRTYSYGAGNSDVYLIKTDSLGDTLWTRTYGGAGYDQGSSVIQTEDGGYIIGGHTAQWPDYNDAYFIKTDSIGDIIWTERYSYFSSNHCFSISTTSDGGYIATGPTYNGEGYYIYLIRLDSLGDSLWTKACGNGSCGYNGGRSVQQTYDDGFIITGQTNLSTAGGYDVYLVKTDSLGDTVWTKKFGGIDDDYGCSVQQTSDRGFIIGGSTKSYGAGWHDIYLIKTDSIGDTLWTKVYGDSLPEECYSAMQTTDGGYIIGGYTASYGIDNMPDAYIIKTDSMGNALWSRTYGGSEWDGCYSISQTDDGGFIMVGYTSAYMGSGPMDIYLIKTDSLGNISGVDEEQNCKIPEEPIDFTISPNPASSSFNIKISSLYKTNVKIVLYDVTGTKIKEIYSGEIDGDFSKNVRLEGVVSGVYFVELASGKTQISRKIIHLR